MPTRNASLTAEQNAVVEKVVKAGEYQNASEAIRDALRVLQQKRRADALKLRALRARVKTGLDALEQGNFTEVAGAELDDYLKRIAAIRSRRTRLAPAKRHPRARWAEAAKRIAESGDDALVWTEFGNADDADLEW